MVAVAADGFGATASSNSRPAPVAHEDRQAELRLAEWSEAKTE
jgi:hypothetical protein